MTDQERDKLARIRKRLPELEKKEIEADTAKELASWKRIQKQTGWK